MRTTVTLAEDVANAVAALRRDRDLGVSEAVNELIRRGLVVRQTVDRFHQRSSDMGLPQMGIDDVGGLLDALEGDDRRS